MNKRKRTKLVHEGRSVAEVDVELVELGAMSASLRSAQPGDARDVVRVLRASRLRFLPYAPPAHSEMEGIRWVSDSLIPSGSVTVASVGEKIVGVLAVSRTNDTSWIDQLYIQPEYCGRGIGSQLLKAALSCLKKPIRLYTFQQNDGARRFYESFGFKPIEYGDGSKNEERCPDVLYELAHDESAWRARRGRPLR